MDVDEGKRQDEEDRRQAASAWGLAVKDWDERRASLFDDIRRQAQESGFTKFHNKRIEAIRKDCRELIFRRG